ncbi:MAG: YhjD/YihY/BrkB family envelope integrity protein [Pseudomonadales bacterium]
MQDPNTNLVPRIQTWLRLNARSVWPATLGYIKLLRAQFAQHDCLTAAGALTYTSLLALVPLMTVTYIGLSLVPQYAELGATVQDFVFRNFVPASSELVQQKLNEFADRARSLTTVVNWRQCTATVGAWTRPAGSQSVAVVPVVAR